MYRTQQRSAPTRPPTTEARPRSRNDNSSVGQAHIPSDNPSSNRLHLLPRVRANPQVTTLVRLWSGLYAPNRKANQSA